MILEAYGHTVQVEAPPDHIGSIVESGVWYESDLLEDVRNRVPPGIAVDVGAHIGVHSLWMSVVCGFAVTALEPWDASHEILLRNIAANQADITPIRAAAGAEPGFGMVVPPPDGNTGIARFVYGTGDIPVVTIDSLGLEPVAVIKIDVEGTEVDVLRGALGVLDRDRPVVYTEANDIPAQRDILEPLGYRQVLRFVRYTPRLCWEHR